MIDGRIFDFFRMVAISSKAFRVGSPAFSVTVVVEGGAVRRVIISVVDWRRKSEKLTSGHFLCFGGKFTVSTLRSALVFGK